MGDYPERPKGARIPSSEARIPLSSSEARLPAPQARIFRGRRTETRSSEASIPAPQARILRGRRRTAETRSSEASIPAPQARIPERAVGRARISVSSSISEHTSVAGCARLSPRRARAERRRGMLEAVAGRARTRSSVAEAAVPVHTRVPGATGSKSTTTLRDCRERETKAAGEVSSEGVVGTRRIARALATLFRFFGHADLVDRPASSVMVWSSVSDASNASKETLQGDRQGHRMKAERLCPDHPRRDVKAIPVLRTSDH